jgi:hypothetical protein
MKSELDFGEMTLADAGLTLKSLTEYITAEIRKERRHELLLAIQEANKRGDTAAEMALLQTFQSL